ncbi:MAG: hypothetical protein ABJF23_24145 [Bryobacteraceae bacterium]
MHARKRLFNYIAILGLAATASPVYSTTVEFAGRAAWLAAVSGVTTTTFDTPVGGYTPPAPGGNVSLPFGGITLDGVTFRGYNDTTEYALAIVTPGPSSQYYNWGTGGAILVGDIYQGALAHFHISFATAVTAWATDLMMGNGVTGNFTVTVNGGACSTACVAPAFAFPQAAFFGMTSDTPISFIDLFVASNGRPELDNFSTATANGGGGPGGGDPGNGGGSETPEVTTMLLCASGLTSLARLKKARTPQLV